MSNQEYIKSLIKEAELYRTQGLLGQSKDTFMKVLRFIKKDQQFRNHKKLTRTVVDKITAIEKDLTAIYEETVAPELSNDVQDLVKNLFSFSKNKDAAEVEGAVALAKFGQYEAALTEFHRLLKEGKVPLVAAKNIIRCHLALSSPNEAIDQFEQWVVSGDLLSKGQLNNIRAFLESVLEKKGIKAKLPVVEAPSETGETEEKEGDVLDISSVGVRLRSGYRKGSMAEFDVTFQSGNVISIVISSKERELVDSLELGIKLADMQFYSPIAIFRGCGIVSRKTNIKSGPKKGDYMLDIIVESG
jgi:hypothetical protein